MTDVRVNFLVSRFQNAFFMELAQVITEELRALGAEARVVSTTMPVGDHDVFVLLPTHEYLVLEGRDHLADPKVARRTIGLTAEQPSSDHFRSNIEVARHLGAVFDFSRQAVAAYAYGGVDARHFQFGWTPSWDRFDPAASRTGPDLVFMGSYTGRRARHLARMSRALWQRDSRIVMSDNSRPNHNSSATFLTGEAKRSLLARAKILINLHQTDEPYFEWLRATEAMLCGTVVLTEPSIHLDPFVDDVHLLVRGAASMPTAIDELLGDDDRMSALRSAAHAELRRRPLRAAAAELLDAAVGLARGPRPWRERVGPEQTAPYQHTVATGAIRDRAEADMLRQALREIRLDLMDVKRQLQASSVDKAVAATGSRVVLRSAADHLAREPARVSVVIALYNHGRYLPDALASVGNDGYEDREIIVVDDGSTDDSLDVAQEWVRANPDVRARVLAVPVNTGLPMARNTGIAAARGEFCFILDADNAVLPGGIRQLVDALDGDPAAAFAYGILQNFGSHGPLGLMGVYPWEPARLATGNYIDAMSLIRRAVLAQVGGYSTDRRLYGWEDYDLWCRIAEAGGYAIHLPRVVGRYRTALSSMLSLSDLSHDSAFDALHEHAPRLMDGSLPAVAVTRLLAGEQAT